MRVRYKPGCVWLDGKTWYFRAGSGTKAQRIGTTTELKTLTAARRAAQPLVDAANNPESAPTVTIGAVIGRYKKEELPRVRKCTQKSYLSWLDLHIYPKWGETAVGSFDAYQFKGWLEGLSLSGKSKAEIKSMMFKLLRLSMLWGYIPNGPNPISLFELRDVKRKKKPPILTVEEFGKLVKQLDEPFATMARLALFQALRVSELLGLKWGDVNWLEKTICIQRSIVCQTEDLTKTPASEAIRPLTDGELEMLKEHRQRCEFTEPENYIFASPHLAGKKPYHYTSVLWKLDGAAKRAKIKHVGTHTFRHTARAWAGELGIPLAVIKDMHRHVDISTTMNVYGGTVPEALREAHSKLVEMVR